MGKKPTTVKLAGDRLELVNKWGAEKGYIQRTRVVNDLIDEEKRRREEQRQA